MAVLQKIRGWGIWLSLIIAFALLLFLIDPSVISRLFGSEAPRETYGYVAGEEITNEDFYGVYQKLNITSDRGDGFQRAWNDIVYTRLFGPWYEKAGVRIADAQVDEVMGNVTEEELAFYGEANVRQMIKQNLSASNYISVFNQTSYINDLFLDRIYDDSNRTITVDMLKLDAPTAGTEISDDEVRAAYKARKYGWAPRNSEVEVVNVHIYPSAADMEAAEEDYNKDYETFSTADNAVAFVRRNSDEAFRDVRYYQKDGDLPEALNDKIFGEGKELTEVIADGYDFTSARVVATEQRSFSGNISVYMVNETEKADSLIALLNTGAETAENLVANHEIASYGNFPVTVNNAKATIAQGVQIDFGIDCLAQPVGQYAVKDFSGARFFYTLTEKDQPVEVKKVAIFSRHINPSKATVKAVTDSVKLFHSQVKSIDDLSGAGMRFGKMAMIYDMTVYDSNNNYRSLEGTVENLKSLTKSVFDHKPGDVVYQSNASTYDLFLVGVKTFRPEGCASFEEVEDALRYELLTRKAAKARLAAVRQEAAGEKDIEALAAKFETEPVFGKVLSMDDARLIGAASALEAGEVGMIDGLDGKVYVFRVVSSDVKNSVEKDQLRNNYLMSEYYRFYQGEPLQYVYRINNVTDYYYRLY